MALCTFGGGVTEIRGSIGGNTFTRNKSGAVIRKRTKPVDPGTSFMERAKNIFTAISSLWSNGGLTETQRQAWLAYAANVPWLNKMGQSITLNGNSRFAKANIARQTAGLAIVLDGPAAFIEAQTDPLFAVIVDEANQLLTIAFDDSLDWGGTDGAGMSIFMGTPQNPGVQSFHGSYRFAGALLGNTAVPLTSPLTIPVTKPVVEGQKLFVQAQILEDDGRMSTRFQSDSTVVA